MEEPLAYAYSDHRVAANDAVDLPAPPSVSPQQPAAADEPAPTSATGKSESQGAEPPPDVLNTKAVDFAPIRLTLGSGTISAADGIKKYAQKGSLFTIGFSYPYQSADKLNSYLGVTYNYGTFAQTLGPLDFQDQSPTFRLVEYDLAASMGFEYAVLDDISLVYEFGPALQSRAMVIKAGINGGQDDSYAAFGVGLIVKVGGEYHLEVLERTLLGRVFLSVETGSKMMSPTLKYSHTQMDINATLFALGLECGYAF